MAKYLLIESRDPFENRAVAHNYELAQELKAAGNDVTLFLVQNGVLVARRSTESSALAAVAKSGVEVVADEFSLRERGLSSDRVIPEVKSVPLDLVIDKLAQGCKALWN